METHKRTTKAAFSASLAAGLLLAGTAHAALGTVEAKFVDRDPVGYPAGVFTFERTGSPVNDTFDGVLLSNSPVGTFVGICLELNESIQAPPSGPFKWYVQTLAESPDDANGMPHLASGMGSARADRLARLVGGAVGGYLPGAYALTPVQQVALQMAVWEIVFETDSSLSVTGGNIRVGSSTLGYGTSRGYPGFGAQTADATTQANTWLGLLGTYTPARNLLAITWDGRQDFLVQTVPIPPAAWLLGSGLLGLFVVARRKTHAA
jgi:hypothetical protein